MVILAWVSITCAIGCSPSEEELAISQYAQGEQLYNTYCASCHEIDTGIGPRLTAKVLSTRTSAQSLYTYNRRNMPYEAGNTLTEEEYWAITAYLIKRRGFADRNVYLSDTNADTLMLTLESTDK